MKDLIQIVIKNVTGSIKTTIIGFIILAAGLVGFFWTDLNVGTAPSIEIMVLGLVVTCLRDPKSNRHNQNKSKKGGTLQVIVTLFMIAALTSCATEKRCAEKYSASSSSDSSRVEIRETVRDTVIYVPGDSAVIYIANPCDSLGNLKPNIFQTTGENGRSTATVVISDKGIKVDCDCAEEYHVIKQMQKEIDRLHLRKSETKTVYIKQFSFWSMLGIGVVVSAISYLLGVIKIHSLIFKK